jgi:C-terminal processing protease CtpA/Prc
MEFLTFAVLTSSMMKQMIRQLLLPVVIAGAVHMRARGQSDSIPLPCMEKAERLLDEALTFMEKNYYRRDDISWPDFREKARRQLETAGNCEDAYASISWCFNQLNEPHSFVMPPDKAARYNGDAAAGSDLSSLAGQIRGEWLQDSIGYLTVPWVSTDDSILCERVADSMQSVIARLDSRHIARWIIDLRQNSGGNCWPMLTGIGPLLGDGVYGYFVSGDERVPIAYHDGSAFQGRHVRCRVSNQGYRTHREQKYIVILTGPGTVSAGETVALAFKGRSLTYFIGQPTAGLTTANATYPLSDRSMLVLTICREADCTGRICQGRINPDLLVPPAVSTNDPAKEAAVSWLTTTNFNEN